MPDGIVQQKGIVWSREAKQRQNWRSDEKGHILLWMDKAIQSQEVRIPYFYQNVIIYIYIYELRHVFLLS